MRVNLSANVSLADAAIRVTLPPGLRFWADGETLTETELAWTQPLSAGDNVIPIAVRGDKPGQYRMSVTAELGKERIEHEVLIEVVDG